MPFNLGIGEVIVVLVIALLVFGARLPEVGRSLGRGIVEFKEGLKGTAEELMSERDAGPQETGPQEIGPPEAEAQVPDSKEDGPSQ